MLGKLEIFRTNPRGYRTAPPCGPARAEGADLSLIRKSVAHLTDRAHMIRYAAARRNVGPLSLTGNGGSGPSACIAPAIRPRAQSVSRIPQNLRCFAGEGIKRQA